MEADTFIVVADKFAEFSVNDRTVTSSQLKSLLSLPHHLLPTRARLLLGQGISDIECKAIVALVEASDNHRQRWDIEDLRARTERADAGLSHKRNACNTLIGSPVMVDENTFHLNLCIDQDCELMGDHQTGQHVQGMVLVEAARQAFLAVTEKHFLKGANHKSYFVINDMSTTFLGFVFPLPAHMEYRIVSKDINDRRQRFTVEVDLVQVGEVRARTNFSFTAYPEDLIAQKEAGLAMEAVTAVRARTQPIAIAA
ncbi:MULTISPECIES: AfsA-related hotdog domain-containing protein [unclassified Aureimonas]|uniref:AfsA-related hotdog domain-containing protein n=1 Tax=unclassified Aureimonas TaxID=2615206 RepID=UPI0006F3E8F6|nr:MULTISPECIES: AfsA-related hotdog domain-containing protein [unclassified Aureimonas]KQT61219.1 hypothetical protein ASG54_24055 [Aureimonas sp. Leaf460]KQT68668.1 hypothetical protein ASG62_18815 [Aureimonas sp. Leaf427]